MSFVPVLAISLALARGLGGAAAAIIAFGDRPANHRLHVSFSRPRSRWPVAYRFGGQRAEPHS